MAQRMTMTAKYTLGCKTREHECHWRYTREIGSSRESHIQTANPSVPWVALSGIAVRICLDESYVLSSLIPHSAKQPNGQKGPVAGLRAPKVQKTKRAFSEYEAEGTWDVPDAPSKSHPPHQSRPAPHRSGWPHGEGPRLQVDHPVNSLPKCCGAGRKGIARLGCSVFQESSTALF